MLFDPHIHTAELPALVRRTVEIATPKACRRCFEAFTAQVRANPLIEQYLNDRFPIELTLNRVLQHREATGRLPQVVGKDDLALHRFYAFAAMLPRVYQRLSPRGQTALAGRVRGALTDDNGLTSLAYELQITAHLMLRGINIEWHDLETGGGFDFLACRHGLEMELECKAFSGDIGRQIHLRRQYQLGGLIYPALAKALERRGSVFIEVTLPGRLKGSELAPIAETISNSLETGVSKPDTKPCGVNVQPFMIEGTPFDTLKRPPVIDQIEGASFIQSRFGVKTDTFLVLMSGKTKAAVVALCSLTADEVVIGVYRQLKSATEQLSGTRPGIICGHFLEMTPTDLLEISEADKAPQPPTGLHLMLNHFFDSENRAHVHTVKFSTPGILHVNSRLEGDMLKRDSGEEGPAYVLTNKRNSFADDARMRLFT